MKKFKRILFLLPVIILFMIFNGCESIIELDLPKSESKLVVKSTFNPDSLLSVDVSTSSNLYNKSDIKKIGNAEVEIYEDGSFIEKLNHINLGIYRSSFKPSEGKEYTIKVSAPNFSNVTSKDRIPVKVSVENVLVSKFKRERDFNEQNKFNIVINDPPGIQNYYYIKLSVSTTSYWDTTFRFEEVVYFNSTDPSITDPNDAFDDYPSMDHAILNDELFDGKQHEIIINTDNYFRTEMKEITLSLFSISKPLYEFYRTLDKQVNSDDSPFSEPIQIYSNIENGYGIFAGYSLSTYIIKL